MIVMDILSGAVGPLIVTVLLGFTTFLLALWYSYRKQSYWKKLGVPHVKPFPFFGSTLELISKPMHDIEYERYCKFGRIYGHFEANSPLLSVAEPEILRSILVKDFQALNGRRSVEIGDKIFESSLSMLKGEDWKRIRSIVTPTFTTGKIKRMFGIFNDCSETLVKNFREVTKKGEIVEVKRVYSAFTMDVIASCAFSTKIDSHNDPNNEFVKAALSFFTIKLNWKMLIFFLIPKMMKWFGVPGFTRCIKFFKEVTLQIMEERKKTGQTRNDFLQLLMDTAKEVGEDEKLDISEKEVDITDNYGKEETDIVFKNITSKKNLSFEEMVAQCVGFFLGGFESIASTLAFITYLLVLNPDAQERLILELDDALKENNGKLTYEAIQSMKYLDNVISETLRLYPPLSRLERVAEEEYKLPETGITIPKGMIITIPIYAMHRDPKFFPNPEKFEPDRWLAEERANRDSYTYMPFGAGPRNCIGMRFALIEIKVCLAHVLSNFRIRKCSKTKVPLDFNVGGLMQSKEINVLFEIRKDTAKAF